MLTAPGRAPLITPQMVIFFAGLFTYPYWAPAIGLYNYIGIEIVIWIIYALGYNLLLGYSGLPSFGHGAFLGIGAYAYGLTQLNLFDSVFGSLIFAIFVSAIAAGIVACFLSHRRGIYFALMTIAFGQIFWFFAIKWHGLTGGEDGLLNVLRPSVDLGLATLDLKTNIALFYFAAVILAIIVVLLWRVLHSPFGSAIQAVRMNETRAQFIGYRVWWIKWTVFTISGAFAGLAGGLYCLTQESAYPDVMSLHASGFIVMMTLIGGGFVSFWGPVVGAIIFFFARDFLGAVTEAWLLWYGLLFMAVMLFEPEGVSGAWGRLIARLRGPQAPTAPVNKEAQP